MKNILLSAAAVAAIILTEIAASYFLSHQEGKRLCEAVRTVLFFCCIGRVIRREEKRSGF